METEEEIGMQIIKENNKLLEITFQGAQEEVFWVTKNQKILYANNSACETLGYSQSELNRLNYSEIDSYVSDRDWSTYWEEVKKNAYLRYETDHKCNDGEKIPVEVSATFISIENSEYLSLFCHDIYKRRSVENKLQYREEQFRLIAEKSIDGILQINKEGNVVYSSPSCTHLFDLEPSEIYDKNFRDLIHPDFKEFFEENLANALQGEKITQIEFALNNPNKPHLYIGANMVMFIGIDEKPIIQLILRDISHNVQIEQELDKSILAYENILVETELLNSNLEREISERKKIEIELEKARRQADLANKAKSEFLANMSHEIRTPLNAVLGFSEILKDKLLDRPDLGSYVEGINTGGRTLLSLINDILDLSKIEAGKLEIQKEPVNPKTLIDEVEQIFGKKIADKGLSLTTELSADSTQALVIDHTRMRQILFNLVGNALKFTSQGTVGIKIEAVPIPGKSNMAGLVLEVSDTGMGIPPKQKELIFEPFEQQEGQSTRKYGGTGLGLSITKRLTEMMNGTLSVRSELKKGSVFTIHFHEVELVGQEGDTSSGGVTDLGNIMFEGSNILLVEDTISNQQVFAGLLEPHNLRISIANNGREALEIIKGKKPDLIFMDLRMPVMDGNETTKIIRSEEKYKDLPIIALSASLLKNYKEENFNIFSESLSKPINRTDLVKVLTKYLPHSFVNSDDESYIESKSEIESEFEFPELNESDKAGLLGYIKEEIEPLLNALDEFFDEEDAVDLSEKLNQFGEKYNISLYNTLAEKLQEHVGRFELSKTDAVLTSIKKLNKKTKVEYGQ